MSRSIFKTKNQHYTHKTNKIVREICAAVRYMISASGAFCNNEDFSVF